MPLSIALPARVDRLSSSSSAELGEMRICLADCNRVSQTVASGQIAAAYLDKKLRHKQSVQLVVFVNGVVVVEEWRIVVVGRAEHFILEVLTDT